MQHPVPQGALASRGHTTVLQYVSLVSYSRHTGITVQLLGVTVAFCGELRNVFTFLLLFLEDKIILKITLFRE